MGEAVSETAGIEQVPGNWKKIIRPYMDASDARGLYEFLSTLVPFILVWAVACQAIKVSFWLALPLSLLNAGFMVRFFVLMHDYGHGTSVKSRRLRDFLGHLCGFITLTPYRQWTLDHAIHHQTLGNLDRRGVGDVWVATVREYSGMSPWRKLTYRLGRSPLWVFSLTPTWAFFVTQRFFRKRDGRRERASVVYTNVFLLLSNGGMALLLGPWTFGAIHLPAVVLGMAVGNFLFYVQHQFEDVYWRREGERDFYQAAMRGSSFLKLPRVLQWFSAEIGFHHIHHLCHFIPHYRLEACYRENPLMQKPHTLGVRDALRCLTLHLYDEDARRLISFGDYRRMAAGP